MVFESLMTPFSAQSHPWRTFLLGLLYASLALLLSLWVFEEEAGLVMVFLCVMAALPLFYHAMRFEERKGFSMTCEREILKSHFRAFFYFMLFFIGVTAAFTAWYVLLPADLTARVFETQTQTITNLNQQVTGGAAAVSLLSKIFLNNVKVMIFSIIFSFIYGSGAIFILVWNSSVISVALGNFIRTHLAQYASAIGMDKVAGYLSVFGLSLLRYSIHGIPEILAYFVAGLAGGILSAAIMRKDYKKKAFERVLLDVSDLIMIAIFLVFIGAILEVFVTPIFF